MFAYSRMRMLASPSGQHVPMDADNLPFLIIAVSSLLGVLFTMVPMVPGTLFIPAGAAAIGFTQGWDAIPVWLWIVQAIAVACYLVVDNIAQLIGVRGVGGSRAAMVGGAIGVFAGPFVLALVSGPLGLLLGPPIGAVAGTILGERHSRIKAGAAPATQLEYQTLGVGALIAFAISVGAKLVIIAAQVAALALAV